MGQDPYQAFTKLHYGCGEISLPGFLNVDIRNTPATDLVSDLDGLIPGFEYKFDTIYLCHVFEHFTIPSLAHNLSLLRKLLVPHKGLLYLSVPDFRILSALYLSGKAPLQLVVRAIHGGQEYPENTHYLSYDEDFLSSILGSAGFTNICKYVPENFLPPGVADTSTYRICDRSISLNIVSRIS